jgi:diguanylate cyclase (GGDEF)-like protein/PAS domain S-box-containing protein
VSCDADGRPRFLLGTSMDITERKRVDDQLKLAASVFTHAREGIMITDAEGTILDVNDTLCRISGFSSDELMGKNPRMLGHGIEDRAFQAEMWQHLADEGFWSGEVWNRYKDGEPYACLQAVSAIRDRDGKVTQYVALLTDITELKRHQQQLEHIAHYDLLTGLPNRVLLGDRMKRAMTLADRHGQRLAIAYLDLDGFKAINDRHGHHAGDQFLVDMSRRLTLALREPDTLARLGGDEFVAILSDVQDDDACFAVIERLLATATDSVALEQGPVRISASIGLTFYPQPDPVDSDQLIRQADHAMYEAKQTGRNRFHAFDPERDRNIRGQHENLAHIRKALSCNEFVLHYQPKVNMRTGQILGVEALIRWQHPQRGLLPPAAFLSLVQDHPLGIELGNWVIASALDQLDRWRAEGLNLPVSVNVDAQQLQQAEFTEHLFATLAQHPGVRPGELQMEVLETSALEDLLRVSRVIDACREFGVTFALDDFGTGYSSLTYLKRLPVTLLKIDRSFVHDMLDSPDDRAILEAVIRLASAFRRQILAEGVETLQQGELLIQMGCELAQGYAIAHPMPAEALGEWVASWQPDPSWRRPPESCKVHEPH